MNFHPRPHIIERAAYVPASEAEVPMLRVINAFVDDFFSRYQMNGWKVLDAGCGRQPFRKRLEEKGCIYSGMDVNQNPEGSVQFVCAIDESLPDDLIQQGPFDLIMCLEVLEHVADWDVAFKNFSSLLKVGGRLVITAPQFFYLHEEPYDFWRPTMHVFEYFALRHGLRVTLTIKGGDAWDIIDTIFSSGKISNYNKSILDKGLKLLMRKVVHQLTRGFFRKHLQKHIEFNQSYYVSNGIELIK